MPIPSSYPKTDVMGNPSPATLMPTNTSKMASFQSLLNPSPKYGPVAPAIVTDKLAQNLKADATKTVANLDVAKAAIQLSPEESALLAQYQSLQDKGLVSPVSGANNAEFFAQIRNNLAQYQTGLANKPAPSTVVAPVQPTQALDTTNKPDFGKTGNYYKGNQLVYDIQRYNPSIGKYETVTLGVDSGQPLGSSDASAGIGGSTGNVGPSTGTYTSASINDINSEYQRKELAILEEKQKAYNEQKAAVDAIIRGDYTLTPGQQQQLQDVANKFDEIRRQQEIVNKNYSGATDIAALVSGRSRYAPEIAAGEAKNAADEGVRELNKINQQQLSTIAAIKSAIQSDNIKMIESQYKAYNDLLNEKQAVIEKMHNSAMAAVDKANEYTRQLAQDTINYSKDVADTFASELVYMKPDGTINVPTADEVMAQIKASGKPLDQNIIMSKIAAKANEIKKTYDDKLNAQKIDLAKSAQASGATPDIIRAINDAGTISDAIIAGGDYLLNASGDIGRYNQYKRDQKSVGQPYVGYTEWQAAADAKKKTSDGLSPSVASQVDAMAKTFDNSQIVKDYNVVVNKKLTVDSIINSKIGGPGDLALVFEFMKALDPNSVVRESEYESAAKSGNIFAGRYARFNGYLKPDGGFLPDNVKKDFQKITDLKYNAITQQYNNFRQSIADRINKRTGNTDGADYLTDYSLSIPQVVQTKRDVIMNWAITNPDEWKKVDALPISDVEKMDYINAKYLDGKGFNSVGGDTQGATSVSTDKLISSLVQQESGGRYDLVGDVPAGHSEEDRALGKYQIVPKYHFAKIGLENTPANRQLFLNSPELQDRLFKQILGELAIQFNNDPRKIAAAYYGGPAAASVVGTPEGDKPQYAGGKVYPSINQYVQSVLSRIS